MKAFIYLITLLFLNSILAKETSSNSELEIFSISGANSSPLH